jgi:predicted ribonuclease YlaK
LADDIIFVTNDLCLKHIAHIYFGNNVESVIDESDSYVGYKEVFLKEEEMLDLYSDYKSNRYNLNINEYLIVHNESNEVVDKLCWTGNEYRHITYDNFNSKYFGKVKPLKDDVYQALVADSFINNKITLVKGPAGSGKTFLSIAFLLSQLERNKIDKIIIFCNTVATKNSAKLGYYPGTKDEKLLDSQIGNLLSSKLGGRIMVE